MHIAATDQDIAAADADAVVLGIYAEGPLSRVAQAVDRVTGGLLAKLKEQKEFGGKPYELLPIVAPAGLKTPLLLLVGLGPQVKFDPGMAYRTAAAAARQLASKPRARVAIYLADDLSPQLVESGLAGAMAGCQGQDLYRAEKNRHPFETLLWAGAPHAALVHGQILGESVNLTRRLVNEPPQDMYPESFAASAGQVADECGLSIEVWDEQRLRQERCGSLLAVAKGSSRPPRLVILRYQGAAEQDPLLAIVGKGVTFDSGGLSLKTTDGMLTMKCDMAGAATMLGAMRAIALLQVAGQRRRAGRAGGEHDRPRRDEAGRRAHGPQRHHDRSP